MTLRGRTASAMWYRAPPVAAALRHAGRAPKAAGDLVWLGPLCRAAAGAAQAQTAVAICPRRRRRSSTTAPACRSCASYRATARCSSGPASAAGRRGPKPQPLGGPVPGRRPDSAGPRVCLHADRADPARPCCLARNSGARGSLQMRAGVRLATPRQGSQPGVMSSPWSYMNGALASRCAG